MCFGAGEGESGATDLVFCTSCRVLKNPAPDRYRLHCDVFGACMVVNAGPYYFAHVMIILQTGSHASPGSCGGTEDS